MLTIVEIISDAFGGHNNHTAYYSIPVPDGWAILPPEVGTPDTLENFPFGEITVDETQTPPVVTGWTPLPMPEPTPEPEPEDETSVWDELDAAYQEGVNSAYDE